MRDLRRRIHLEDDFFGVGVFVELPDDVLDPVGSPSVIEKLGDVGGVLATQHDPGELHVALIVDDVFVFVDEEAGLVDGPVILVRVHFVMLAFACGTHSALFFILALEEDRLARPVVAEVAQALVRVEIVSLKTEGLWKLPIAFHGAGLAEEKVIKCVSRPDGSCLLIKQPPKLVDQLAIQISEVPLWNNLIAVDDLSMLVSFKVTDAVVFIEGSLVDLQILAHPRCQIFSLIQL